MTSESALLRGLVLLYRYTVDITEVASRTLGKGHADNRSVQLLLLISQDPGRTPSQVAETLGVSRSAVSRSLQSLEQLRMISRRRSTGDRRSVELYLTRTGKRHVERFARELADFFAQGAPSVAESMSALRVAAPRTLAREAMDPVVVAMAMASAGAEYVDEVNLELESFGIVHGVDRAALAVIRSHGSVRPGHLGHEVRASPPSVTAMLDRLESRDLIRRRDSLESDRRAVIVDLTDLGEQAVQVILEIFARHSYAIMTALAHTLPFAAPGRGVASA